MGVAARKIGQPTNEQRDEWLRQATAEAIAQAKRMVGDGGIPPNTPVYRLNEAEWGWIVSSAIFGWINVKAKEATQHGLDVDHEILQAPGNPAPWEAGCVEACLPRVADFDLPWGEPIGQWSRDQMVRLLWAAHGLIDDAMSRRDRGKDDDDIIRPLINEGTKMPSTIKDDEIPF